MKILLMFYILQIKAIQFSVDTIVSVTDGVLQKHHAMCLYILQTPLQQDNISESITTYMTLLKELKSRQIAVIPISSLGEKSNSYKCNENPPFYLLLYNDMDTKEELKKISSSIFARGRWLQFFTENMELDDFFRDVSVPYDCEFIVVQRVKDGLVLTEVYRQYLHQILQKYEVAKWIYNNFNWTKLSLLERRKNLQGVTINVAILKMAVSAVKAKCVNMENDLICRTQLEIWTTIQNATNCLSKYIPSEQDTTYLSENGTWMGVIDLLISDQADVAIGDFGMTSERKNVVNYMSVTSRVKITTFIRKPETGKSGWNYILQPFSSSFWWIVLLTLVIFVISLTQTWYMSMCIGCSQENENYSLYNSCLIIYAIFCQQGHDTTPVSWSCRIVYLTAYLTYVVLFSAYSAIYISMLAVQYDTLPFTDFRELVDIGTYDFGVTAGSFFVNVFDKAADPILQKVYEKMLNPREHSLPENETEGFRRVCEKGNYAFFFDWIHKEQPSCELVEVPRASIFFPISFLISKNSPYHRIFSHQMEKLRRTGILKRIEMLGIPFTNDDDTLSALDATLEDTIAIFVILFGGLVVAILCLVAELIYFYTSRHDKNLVTSYETSLDY